jgi:hypothetical protein
LIPIIGELPPHLFGFSIEEDLIILRENIRKLMTAINTTLNVQKVQASIASYQRDKLSQLPRKFQKQSTQ